MIINYTEISDLNDTFAQFLVSRAGRDVLLALGTAGGGGGGGVEKGA